MEKDKKEKYLQAFVIAFAGCMLSVIPIMVINGGRFFYYGDYNKQQIMFYQHMHDLVRSGGLSAWDSFADLGSDTVASYSFYLLGSPFFWLMTLFPSKLVITLMPVFIALKTGLASVGAYGFARRFCSNRNAALIGAVLFGLSAYNAGSMIFNHFHDAVLLLPFMLWALEGFVRDGRRGWFAVTVALAAFTNYYFFFGQVIFLLIYFFTALLTGHFRISAKSFVQLAFEAVVGVLIAAVLLLPSAMAVLNNPRVSDFISGTDMLIYKNRPVYLYILKSIFLLPDITLINNFGNTVQDNFHSLYLYFFSLCGVITYFRTVRGKDFLKLLIGICGVMLAVPVLNQSFSFFNSLFYGRWFYMPVLVMCVMTSKAVEMWHDGEADLKKGFVPGTILTAAAAAAALAVVLLSKFGVIKVAFQNYTLAYVQIIFPLASAAFLWLVLFRPETQDKDILTAQLLKRTVAFSTAGMCLIVWCAYMYLGTSDDYQMNDVYDYRDSGETLDDGSFFRVSSETGLINMPVIWGLRTVRYFNSTVEPTVMSFYQGLGLTRSVKSDYEPAFYPLMELLSVRYYADSAYYDENGDPLPADEYLANTDGTYELLYQKNEINFYENRFYLPIGFAFDSYTTNEALDGQQPLMKSYACLEALILDSGQISKYSDILTEYDINTLSTAASRYEETVGRLRKNVCTSFEYEGSQFTAHASPDRDCLMFFSIPYSEGWSAEINGAPAEIENVDNGLMAVRCPKGDCEIKFVYRNKYLSAGAIITFAAAGVFAVYIAAGIILGRRKREKNNE